jgi:hypothetical protein
VVSTKPINILAQPSDGTKTVGTLQSQDEIIGVEVVKKNGDEENCPHGQTYVRLADGRGWIPINIPGEELTVAVVI